MKMVCFSSHSGIETSITQNKWIARYRKCAVDHWFADDGLCISGNSQ